MQRTSPYGLVPLPAQQRLVICFYSPRERKPIWNATMLETKHVDLNQAS